MSQPSAKATARKEGSKERVKKLVDNLLKRDAQAIIIEQRKLLELGDWLTRRTA
jgi:hypothetical protein